MDDIHSRGHARLASIYHHLATKVPQAPVPEFNNPLVGELHWDMDDRPGHFHSLRVLQLTTGEIIFITYAGANIIALDNIDEVAEQLEFSFPTR